MSRFLVPFPPPVSGINKGIADIIAKDDKHDGQGTYLPYFKGIFRIGKGKKQLGDRHKSVYAAINFGYQHGLLHTEMLYKGGDKGKHQKKAGKFGPGHDSRIGNKIIYLMGSG
jgi:hypothetical protein